MQRFRITYLGTSLSYSFSLFFSLLFSLSLSLSPLSLPPFPSPSPSVHRHTHIHIYIYIYIYKEREIHIYIYVYVYVYVCIDLPSTVWCYFHICTHNLPTFTFLLIRGRIYLICIVHERSVGQWERRLAAPRSNAHLLRVGPDGILNPALQTLAEVAHAIEAPQLSRLSTHRGDASTPGVHASALSSPVPPPVRDVCTYVPSSPCLRRVPRSLPR